MSEVLIVVDMLRGFCEEGHPLYCGPQSRRIIPFVRQRAEAHRQAGEPLIFLADNHAPDDAEFERFPPHCIAGTEEARIIPELADLAAEATVIPKTRYAGFYGTNLEELLRRLNPDRVELVGVCTNICVFFTAEELRNRDIPVRVPRAGVASFDQEAHEFALQQMDTVLGCEIV